MRSKLFSAKAESIKTSAGTWVCILPGTGEGYQLYDRLREDYLGRILFDKEDNWIYDGQQLTVDEQEAIAGLITGNQKEMENLVRNLY